MTLRASAKAIARRLISPLMEWTGHTDRKLDQLTGVENRLLVLMYHRIISDPAEDPFRLGMCVTRETFESHLRYFRQHYHLIGLDDALARIDAGETLPARSVALTFDDGYRDNLINAAPALVRHHAPATFYVVTGELDNGQPLWWDRVIAAVARTRETSIDTETLDLPGLPARLALTPLRRAGSLQALIDAIWELPAHRIEAVVLRLHKQLKPTDDPRLAARRMSPLEIIKLAAGGFAIGAHTVRHADPRTQSGDELRQELVASRHDLEQIIQMPVTSFAYPAGRMTPELPELVRAVGFANAVSTVRGINALPFNRFALARIGMPESTLADFKRAIRNVPVISGSTPREPSAPPP